MITARARKVLWVYSPAMDIALHKTSILEILGHLAKRGYETHVIVTRSRNVFKNYMPEVRTICVPLRHVPVISSVMFAITIFLFLPLYLIVSKPDYIVTGSGISALGLTSVLPFSKLRKAKAILDIRSIPVELRGCVGFLQAFWFGVSVQLAKRLFDGMTIITPLMRHEVCKRFDIDPKQVGLFSSGVSTELFRSESFISEGRELRRKLGLSGKFVILYHGWFSANRGLAETIRAMLRVRRVCPDVVLFLLGAGPTASTLKELIQEEQIQDNVVIHEPVDYAEVPKYVAMCDVGIVPLPNLAYWRSQCPLKLLEYLAMKKPVIVTDIPAHRSIIGDEKCGIYASSVEPAEIAKSIECVYRNRQKLGEWGASGRKIVDEKYSWERVAGNLDNYLLSIDTRR